MTGQLLKESGGSIIESHRIYGSYLSVSLSLLIELQKYLCHILAIQPTAHL